MFINDAHWQSADGDWYGSPADVPAPEELKMPDIASVVNAARSALLERAAANGIKVDGRWSDKRLAEELAKG